MFGIHSADGYQEIINGVKIKAVNYGDNMIMTEVHFKKGSVLPDHSHINEQTGYLIKGKIRLFIDGAARELNPGDSWNIGSNLKHKAEVLEDTVVIEIFNPAREDYFKYINNNDIIK